MTASGTERRGLLNEIGAAITNVAVPHHEPPAVVLCRRIVVVIVLVIGAALLGFSLSRTPGESSFYWLDLRAGRGVDRRSQANLRIG